MNKAKTIYVCSECGSESPKWQGQCPTCKAWNTMFEQKVKPVDEDDKRRINKTASHHSKKISEVASTSNDRLDTKISEFNKVLGGGLVHGSLTLISGEPGIGKSTLILDAASKIAEDGTVLYVSGEESEEQIKLRADRICKDTGNLFLLSETNLEAALAEAENIKPDLLIIDSIQTMYSDDAESLPGSITQVRQCGCMLMNYAKGLGVPVLIVAHVNKSGDLAGPKILEHLVDTVLSFTGDRTTDLRILKAVKNRFGATSEIGAFEMAESGLIPVENLSKIFLEGRQGECEGSIVTAVYEGTKPLLLEVQALTGPSTATFAMRRSLGINQNRLSMIIAVLEKKAMVKLYNKDIFANIVGGYTPEGTSFDLAIALAIYSDIQGIKVPNTVMALGEIGLTGELRPVQNCEKLIKEAERMGFQEIILPKRNCAKLLGTYDVKLIGVSNVTEAINAL